MKKLLLVSVIALSAQSSFAWSGTFYNVIENSSDLTFNVVRTADPGWDNWGWSGWSDIGNGVNFLPNTVIYQGSGSSSSLGGMIFGIYFKYSSRSKFTLHNYVNNAGANIHIYCEAYPSTQDDKAIWWFGYKNGSWGENFPDMQANISVKNSTDKVGYYDLYYSFSRPTNKGTVNIFDPANAISVSGAKLPYTGVLKNCFTK